MLPATFFRSLAEKESFQDDLAEPLRLLATHIHNSQLLHRFDALRSILDGARENLLRSAGLADRLVKPAQQEIGLLPALCQLASLTTMLECFDQHDAIAPATKVKAPTVMGATFAL